MRLTRFEIPETKIGSFLNSFEHVALLLENTQRVLGQLITFFAPFSTELEEYHFRSIIRSVQNLNMPCLPDPAGHPNVKET
jgi:hypothetical protein